MPVMNPLIVDEGYNPTIEDDILAPLGELGEDDTIVSCAFLLIVMKPMSPAFINGKTATVLNVYTLPAYRRREYARMLMNAMIADAKELNIDVIELKATADGYDLYRSVGFEDDRSKYHLMKWKAQRKA